MSQNPPLDRETEKVENEEKLAISNARAYNAPKVTVYFDRGRCCTSPSAFVACLRSSTSRSGLGSSQITPLLKRWQRSCVAVLAAHCTTGLRRDHLRSPSSRLM